MDIFQDQINNIIGASYAGNPKPNTVMFVAKKVERLLANLDNVSGCLVFVESGCDVSDAICKRNTIVETPNPQLEYARFVQLFVEAEEQVEGQYPPVMTDGGYYLSPNALIGNNVCIEPGAIVYGSVSIGEGAVIHSGAVVRHADIESGAIIKTNACIGGQGFNYADSEDGIKVLMPCIGRVEIGACAEVGCMTTVCRGMAGNTVLDSYSKIDDHVHVGHDVFIGRNAEITAGTIIGGFCSIGEEVFIGMNSTLKNRVSIGPRAFVGMGSSVVRDVAEGAKVFGNPAKPMRI